MTLTLRADLYLSRPVLSCFDGEPVIPGSGNGTPPIGDPGNGTPPIGDPGKTFTQEDLNRFLAEDRRKHQQQYQTQLQKMETQLQEVLASKTLTDTERKALEENLNAVQGQLRSKEQQLALEKKQLEEQFNVKLSEAEKKAGVWESLYRESTIDRSLQDAAVKHEAFSPAQIMTLMRPWTKMIEVVDEVTGKPTGKHKPVVEMPDTDEKTGESAVFVRTPDEAVKRMKELPEMYGNLFKSGVVSGIGLSSATGGLTPGSSGRVDVRKLTAQQYREIREKNPEALGLRPKAGRR